MKNKKQLLILIMVLLTALFVRVYRLSDAPPSLFSDELDMGIQARSLLQTGTDYRNTLSPFYIRSYNADRTPLPIWLTMITTAVFKQPELQIRMAPAIEGTVIVLLAFLLIRQITGSAVAGMLAGLVFALNPWQIQFSRIGFEAASLGMLYLGGLAAFLKWVNSKENKWLYISTFLFSLSIYTYRTMTLFAPLTFLSLAIIYFKELWALKTRDKLLTVLLALSMMVSFIFATTVAASDQLRINQISIFSDKMVPVWIQRNREVDSGDLIDATVGKSATFISKVFHNKPSSWYIAFKNNYLEALSIQFLFTQGDPDLRQSTGRGLILTMDFVPLIIGGYWLLKNRRKKFSQWILIWIILAPIPSALTTDGGGGHHATRLFLLGMPVLLTIALGWWQVWKWLAIRPLGKMVGVTLLLLYLVNFGFYYHFYQIHYPLEAAKFFGYGYKQALEEIKIEAGKHQYEALKLTTTLDPPLPYFWFWNSTPTRDIQSKGLDFGGKIAGIDRVEAVSRNENDLIEKNVLYLLAKDDMPIEWRGHKLLPVGVKIIKTIYYPDQQPVFYLVTRLQ